LPEGSSVEHSAIPREDSVEIQDSWHHKVKLLSMSGAERIRLRGSSNWKWCRFLWAAQWRVLWCFLLSCVFFSNSTFV
jgi:hypothetical protein